MMYSCYYNPLFVILQPIFFSEGAAVIMKSNICSKLANSTKDEFHIEKSDNTVGNSPFIIC